MSSRHRAPSLKISNVYDIEFKRLVNQDSEYVAKTQFLSSFNCFFTSIVKINEYYQHIHICYPCCMLDIKLNAENLVIYGIIFSS